VIVGVYIRAEKVVFAIFTETNNNRWKLTGEADMSCLGSIYDKNGVGCFVKDSIICLRYNLTKEHSRVLWDDLVKAGFTIKVDVLPA
jgi:hypothetical protein